MSSGNKWTNKNNKEIAFGFHDVCHVKLYAIYSVSFLPFPFVADTNVKQTSWICNKLDQTQ